MAGGRPSKFKKEFIKQAEILCRLGATDKELAEFFEVEETTINNWKIEHPEFFESLKNGKNEADELVEKSLFQRAKGYSHEAVKIFNHEGQALEVPYTEHYPPDTTACIFWLKNRRREQWRDRQEHELTPKGQEQLAAILEVVRKVAK